MSFLAMLATCTGCTSKSHPVLNCSGQQLQVIILINFFNAIDLFNSRLTMWHMHLNNIFCLFKTALAFKHLFPGCCQKHVDPHFGVFNTFQYENVKGNSIFDRAWLLNVKYLLGIHVQLAEMLSFSTCIDCMAHPMLIHLMHYMVSYNICGVSYPIFGTTKKVVWNH